MGSVTRSLAEQLRDALSLERGVETGTYTGGGSRVLAEVFPTAATIELSPQMHAEAEANLADLDNITLIQGDSREELRALAQTGEPTFYFLDGHWSGGATAGEGSECPVIEEIAAISPGNPEDCIVIDDARLFTAAPPPPHDPAQWPTLLELIDAVRAAHPGHHITVLHDQVIAAPARVKPILDAYGQVLPPADEPPAGLARRVLSSLRK
jgi:hypothetical protein